MIRFEDEYSRGYQDAWEAYNPGTEIGEPKFASEVYELGWWNGIGAASAWHEGYDATQAGVMVCPYLDGADDDCFREDWMHGCITAFEIGDIDVWGHA